MKYYFRGGMAPGESFSPGYIINRNVLGSNVGNFLYLNSVMRAIMTDKDTVLDVNHYSVNGIPAERVNEEYDAFIIPLADAFRVDFMPELDALTSFVKKLTIPCVVTGVGLRADYEPKLDEIFPFDAKVKSFMNAVLEKSACVGVRGEITGEYLKKLGYSEEKDYTVIGCPSMYTNGSKINIKPLKLSADSMISFNSNPDTIPEAAQYVIDIMKKYPGSVYTAQLRTELHNIYVGAPYEMEKIHPMHSVSDEFYKSGRVRFFTNTNAWFDFLKTCDFSFGMRLHGNIAAILSGTPGLLLATDSRTRELASYHMLNAVTMEDVRNLTFEELVMREDYDKPARQSKKNFEHFVDFLNRNGLKNIYENGFEPEVAYFDMLNTADKNIEESQETLHSQNQMACSKNTGIILPLSSCNPEEQAARFSDYYGELEERFDRHRSEVAANKSTIKSLKADIKGFEKKISESANELTEKDKVITNLNEKLSARKEKIQELKDELATEKSKVKKMREKFQNEQQKNEELEKILSRRSVKLAIKVSNMFRKKKDSKPEA